MSYYNIKVHINLPSSVKNNFIRNRLIPFCNEKLGEIPYYFSRNIEFGPVINLYVQCSEKEITYFYSELYNQFNQFLEALTGDEQIANNVYIERYRDLKKMNGIKNKKQQDNLTIMFYKLDTIERHGEYGSELEKEIFTEYFFKSQNVVEKTIRFFNEAQEQVRLNTILGLFTACAQVLDNTGIGQGYLSFKSHLLGFLSYKHKDMPKYERYFENNFTKNERTYREIVDIVRHNLRLNELAKEQTLFEIIYAWKQIYTSMYEDMLRIIKENPPKKNLLMTFNKSYRAAQFRSISPFHKKAFASNNRSFFESLEFQAYRMVVNYVYQTLPTLGVNSRKRVEMSYVLVHSMESVVKK